jgi:hypothetical protein
MDVQQGRSRRRIGRFGEFIFEFVILPTNDKFSSKPGPSLEGLSNTRIMESNSTHVGFVTMTLISNRGFDKYGRVTIPNRLIHRFMKVFKAIEKAFDRDDIFFTDDEGKLAIDTNVANQLAITIPLVDSKQLKIKHELIYADDSDKPYEGVIIYLNRHATYGYMTYDELCACIYNMDKVDYFVYTELMVMEQLERALLRERSNESIGQMMDLGARMDKIQAINKSGENKE